MSLYMANHNLKDIINRTGNLIEIAFQKDRQIKKPSNQEKEVVVRRATGFPEEVGNKVVKNIDIILRKVQ